MNVLHHLAMQSEALVILLQETHCTDAEKLVLPNYQLAGSSLSRKHGLATFVHERLRYTLLDQSPPTSEIEWLCVDVDGYKIVNVYKPPPTRLRTLDLPVFPHPCLYAGDFNCRHADWGYDDNSPDGECLAGWASINCLALLYNAKDAVSFYSGRWNTGTNPDLAFASVGPNSRLPDRRVLEKFPRSQHRPSLITPPRFAMVVPSMLAKRWNFRKAKWSHYIALTNKFAKTLLPPDSLDVDAAYQDFCNTIKKAAKKTIPREYRNNYIPCWDAECESLYKTFLQSPQGDESSLAATALLAKLDRKRRDRWSEAVRSILIDIFDSLNMQEKKVICFLNLINAFIEKLSNWRRKVQKGNFLMFSSLADIFNLDDDVKTNVAQHISKNWNANSKHTFPKLAEMTCPLQEIRFVFLLENRRRINCTINSLT